MGDRGRKLVSLAISMNKNEKDTLSKISDNLQEKHKNSTVGRKCYEIFTENKDNILLDNTNILDDNFSVCSDSESDNSRQSTIFYMKQAFACDSYSEEQNQNNSENNQIQSENIIVKPETSQIEVSLNNRNLAAVVAEEKFCINPRNKLITRINDKENIDNTIVNFGKIIEPPKTSVEQLNNLRPWTKQNTCPYCFIDVTHFSRHLQRNHKEEGAVRELLQMSFRDPKRKNLLDAIRRQGNYLYSNETKDIRPVRRPRVGTDLKQRKINETYVVCQYCLGFFKRDYLRRHRKKCGLRSETRHDARENHLSESRIFSVCNGTNKEFYKSLRLKKEVFKIMRADEISNIAMNDVLICSYAESLLRRHKRVQIKNTISNKMRELGRMLLVLKETTGVRRFMDILKPEFFDNIVSATKVISGYDCQSQTFKASSLALHMGTTLKQICDTATKLIIKKSRFIICEDREAALKDIKRIKNLVENHWNFEISSLALKDLNEEKWEKPNLFPLTSDVMKFQEYVSKSANAASDNLQAGKDLEINYRRLAECVLALTLLLNRKRIGEIQYLRIKTYSKESTNSQQEEFLDSLSDTEKILTKNFKRVITGGKGTKPVAILFPKSIQMYIMLMLKVREQCVPNSNEYLFANPSTENRWLSGYHTLKKLASKSGVQNERLFTSTRLRKQIATVLQVLNITDSEMEQFANFMGHTKKTHESYYRLPQDVYQTAKVSKLLLAINKGKTSEYKGKTLDEIEISDNESSEDSDVELNKYDNVPCTETNIDSQPKKEGPKKYRNKWTEEQKTIMKQYFSQHITSKKSPKKEEVENFKKTHPNEFSNKAWTIIKVFIYNCYKDL